MASIHIRQPTLPGSFSPSHQPNSDHMAEVNDSLELTQPGESSREDGPSNFQIEWQELPSVTKYVKQDKWQHSQFPSALEKLPDNPNLSQRLHDILRWSLQRPNPATDISNSLTNVIPTISDVDAAPEQPLPEASPGSNKFNEYDSSPPATPLTVNTSEPISISVKARTRKTNALFTRLKRLRQDVALKRAASVRHKEEMIAHNIPSPEEQTPLPGECISCFEEFPKTDLTNLDCSHDYCKACLHEVVVNAMKTESAFPPKCCLSEISRKQILSCLSSTEREDYKDKSAEYSIPAGHRWYCPDPKCAKWIKPEKLHHKRKIDQVCPHCEAKICSICRSLSHPQDEDCPQDFGLESTLEIANSEGWRRCYSCRTMVELTTGCRHITCRCGAEFCYVCNARWRTCQCTEADKERRLAELRSQREQRTHEQEEADAAAEAEAEEVAEAIRQVEQMELEETARREEQERQLQLEEELALARLEEERLLEEIARREAEAELENQLRETLLASSKEECQGMMNMLVEIINFQQGELTSEHQSRESAIVQTKEADQDKLLGKFAEHSAWLEDNIKRRKQVLKERQEREQQSLQAQAEEEEDDMFLQMQIYLKDKPNREAREKKMRDALQKKQSEQNAELSKRHNEECQSLESGIFYEREGMRKAASVRLDPISKTFRSSVKILGQQIGSDREWFQLVSTRRIEMMKEHEKIVLQQMEAGEEPVGLTEALSAAVEPMLPNHDAAEHLVTATEDTPSTRPISVRQLRQEDEDMYSHSHDITQPASGHGKTSADHANPLHRSDTMVHPIPGSYPTPGARPTSVAKPMQSIDHHLSPQYQRIASGALSRSDVAYSTALSATRISQPQQANHAMDQRESQTAFNPWNPWQSVTSKPLSIIPSPTFQTEGQQQNLAPVSPIHSRNESTGTVSTRGSASIFSNTSSISPPSSKHSSVVVTTDADVLDSMAANIVVASSSGSNHDRDYSVKGGGILGSRFGRKSLLMSEEEMRRRMTVETVGSRS